MLQPGRLILASQSATRAAVLAGAGLVFEARPARIDEAAVKAAGLAEGAGPEDVALTLATMKARRIREPGAPGLPGAVVIGADQLLVCEDGWFDKPTSLDQARAHLVALRGRTHTLVTALVCHRDGTEIWRHLARPRLTMRPFSDAFLDDYLALEGEALLGCVGAYRLEGPGAQLFDRVEGEHAAVLGLPLLPLLGFLRQCGVLAS